MKKIAKEIKPEDIIEIIFRRRWYIIIPFCLSMVVGICLAFMLPKIYRAETVILIQPQKVPASFVKSVVTSDISSRISTISEQILSRSNLEKIIEDFDLFSDPKFEGMYLEDKISRIRGSIGVHVKRSGRRQANAFSISVVDQDPMLAMKVANSLATYFLDENLRLREAQSVGTTEFIDNEREVMGERMENVDKSLREFRQKHMGELPEQLESNLRILDRLQMNMNERQQRLSNVKDRLVLITSGNSAQYGIDDFKTIDQLQQELANLKTRYTDRHPDVVRLEKQIAKIQESYEKGAEQPDEASSNSVPSKEETSLYAITMRRWQRQKTEKEIANLEKEIGELEAKIKMYQKRVENTPKRDYELTYLSRDYRNVQKAYGSLLSKKIEAEIASNMEKQQKGEQFRILDPARLPEKPISPDERRLFLIMIASGLGLGGGLIFLLEYLNTSFRSSDDIESYLGFSVLASLPLICHPENKRKEKLNNVLSIFSITLSLVLLTAFAVLSFNGIDNTMELINKLVI